MSRDEVSPSSYAADQAWFSMLLVNDPNTALVGSLLRSRQHPVWEVLLRPFRGPAPLSALEADGGTEIPGLRSRPTGWISAGLVLLLGVGVASVLFHPAPAPQLANVAGSSAEPSREARAAAAAFEPAPALTTNIVALSPEPRAQARAEGFGVLPRAAKAAATSASAQKRPAARPLPRKVGRALTGRSTSR